MEAELIMERIGVVEGKLYEHERIFDEIRDRFNIVENRFNRVEAQIERLDKKIDTKFDALDAKITRLSMWIIGLLMTSWLSIILVMLRLKY